MHKVGNILYMFATLLGITFSTTSRLFSSPCPLKEVVNETTTFRQIVLGIFSGLFARDVLPIFRYEIPLPALWNFTNFRLQSYLKNRFTAQALEQRVCELEEENACFRQALNLAPSNRPPLGKGPTGTDKVKSDISSAQSLGFHSSHGSSSPESPGSRGSSQSPPSGITVSMSSRPMTVIEPSSWTETMLLTDHQHHQHPDISDPSESQYHLAPMSAPLPQKPLHYPYANNNFPSSSRPLSNSLYSASPIPYNHSSDPPMSANYGVQHFTLRGEVRDEPSRPQYSYAQSFSSPDPNMRSRSSSPSTHSNSYNHHNTHRGSPLPYPHRRASIDSQGFSLGQGFPHLPNPTQFQHNSRPPDYLRQQDGMHLTASRTGGYGPDCRLNPTS